MYVTNKIWFDSLHYIPTLQSYVHPFKHTLLINLWWVVHHVWWTNKVLYVRRLNKEQNHLLLYYYLCPGPIRALCHFPWTGLWQKLTFILMFNKCIIWCVCGRLTTMSKNYIWECTDPGARGGTQMEIECLKGYGTVKSLVNTGLAYTRIINKLL